MKKRGCGKKGCLFGCLGMVLAFLLFSGLSSYWLVKKGEYVAPEAMVFPDTDFYVKAEVRKDDEQMVEFLLNQMQRINDSQMEDVKQVIPFLTSGDMRSKKARRDVKKMLPIRVEMGGDLREADFVMAIGFSLYNNMAKMGFWFLKRVARKDDNGVYREINGKVYIKPSKNDLYFLALENNTFYLAQNEDSMRRVLDPQAPAAGVEETHPLLTRVNQDATIWGIFRGASLADAVDSLDIPGASYDASNEGILLGESTMRTMVFDGGATSLDTLTVRFFCDVNPVTPETKQILESLFDNWVAELDADVEKTVVAEDSGYLVTLEMKPQLPDTATETP